MKVSPSGQYVDMRVISSFFCIKKTLSVRVLIALITLVDSESYLEMMMGSGKGASKVVQLLTKKRGSTELCKQASKCWSPKTRIQKCMF